MEVSKHDLGGFTDLVSYFLETQLKLCSMSNLRAFLVFINTAPQPPLGVPAGAVPVACHMSECGVCLTLPEGEVHQCNESHCYCVECWGRLDPRRCPECRQPVPQANRNRAAERAIATLQATCDHCGEATTRGTKAAHLLVCPQRPTACAGAAAGCDWLGMAAEQEAHEVTCPIAVCQRLVAPLQERCDGLQTQNQQLQARVAALEPHAGDVRALEGDEEADGWQQRQRVEAAPHDAPPSDAAVEEMELAETIAALHTHVTVARVAEQACTRLEVLCLPDGSEQAAADAGVLEAVVAAMQAHPQEADVQMRGCMALFTVCCGEDAAGPGRRQRAAEAEVLEALVDALLAHPQAAALQVWGCMALTNVCCGDDAAAPARKQQAAEAEALEAVVAAMWAHPQVVGVQQEGCRALTNVCRGHDAAGLARKQRAAQVGGRGVAAAAMQAHPAHREMQCYGQRVLDYLPGDRLPWRIHMNRHDQLLLLGVLLLLVMFIVCTL